MDVEVIRVLCEMEIAEHRKTKASLQVTWAAKQPPKTDGWYEGPWAEVIPASFRLEISQISTASAGLGSSNFGFQSVVSTHGHLRDKIYVHLTFWEKRLLYCELDPKLI